MRSNCRVVGGSPKWGSILFPLACFFLAILASGGSLRASEAVQAEPVLAEEGYSSAAVCGKCHADIYKSWKKSMHSHSLADPIFETAYMQAIFEFGDEVRPLCLRCHAPMTMTNGDILLSDEVTREGVSCDFCHTVKAVSASDPDRPFVVEPGPLKRSVLEKATSPAHRVAYSALHGESRFCGGCHNFVSPLGVMVLGTYQEWLDGPMPAEGIQCQDCHMALSPGRVAKGDSGSELGGKFHLHSLIHDANQVEDALSLRLLKVLRNAERLYVEVEVQNVGSGHMVPTGMPMREVILSVSAESGGRIRTEERRYRKVIVDEQGRPLDRDYRALILGARVLSDNRIAPRERRTEKFWIHVRPEGAVRVSARLIYSYAPWVQQVEPIRIDVATSARTVR